MSLTFDTNLEYNDSNVNINVVTCNNNNIKVLLNIEGINNYVEFTKFKGFIF
jgi:hypothetical protein